MVIEQECHMLANQILQIWVGLSALIKPLGVLFDNCHCYILIDPNHKLENKLSTERDVFTSSRVA